MFVSKEECKTLFLATRSTESIFFYTRTNLHHEEELESNFPGFTINLLGFIRKTTWSPISNAGNAEMFRNFFQIK